LQVGNHKIQNFNIATDLLKEFVRDYCKMILEVAEKNLKDTKDVEGNAAIEGLKIITNYMLSRFNWDI